MKQAKWTKYRASIEFGIDRKTLENRLMSSGAKPDENDHYTARQVYEAMVGDFEAAKTREALARAEKLEHEVAELRGQLVRTDKAIAVWSHLVVVFRQGVSRSSLSAVEKESLLKGLREIDVEELVKWAVGE